MTYRVGWSGMQPAINRIWDAVLVRNVGEWAISADAEELLRNYLEDDEAETIFNTQNSRERNRVIRTIISRHLLKGDEQQKKRLAKWVVSSWGGIYGVEEAQEEPADWAIKLADYNYDRVKDFAELKEFDRIASWSKLLAFANHDEYAIFDSRIALALNIILSNTDYFHRFKMPVSQIEIRNEVAKHIRVTTKNKIAERQGRRKKLNYIGYMNYLDFLKASVQHNRAASILDAEMDLFYYAPILINQYIGANSIVENNATPTQ